MAIALIDANSFYCSAELLFQPWLRNKPIVVAIEQRWLRGEP
ncbi:Y-family DNA polymerase [Azotobacter chroococcum]